MIQLTDAFALLGINLVLCGALLTVLHALRCDVRHGVWVRLFGVLFFAMLWIPLGQAGIPAVAYVRGITADLSITLLALAVWRVGHLALGWRAMPKRDERAVTGVVAFAALLLYPLALGWGDWDAYRLGWGSWGMLLVLLGLCVISLAKGLRVLPALVALALMAWSLGLMESGNLWDYLLDPWLSVFAIGSVFIKCTQVPFRRFR